MTETQAAPVPPAPPRRRHVLRALLIVAVLAAAIGAGAVYWLLGTSGGAQLVMGRVAGMLGKGTTFEGVQGSLGGPLAIDHIVVQRPDLVVRIDGVDMDSSLVGALRGTLVVHRLYVRRVEVRTAGPSADAKAPVMFKPPYPVRLEDGRVATFIHGSLDHKGEDLVLRDIALKGDGDDTRWRIERAAAATPYGAATISGTLATAKPYGVDLDGAFDGKVQEQALHVVAKAKGTLQDLEARADGAVGSMRGTAVAVLQPFAKAPLKSVTVDARDVDLSKVSAGLPATRLALEARLAPHGDSFAGPVRVVNADPGPWDAGKLPFAFAGANVVANARRTEAQDLELKLAGGGGAAGRGSYENGTLQATLQLSDVDLAALHRSLEKTRLAGRIALEAQKGGQRFDVALRDPRFALEGRAALANDLLEVETARVSTGAGAATARGTVALEGAKEFRFEGRGEHFDPGAIVKGQRGDLNFAFAMHGTLAGGVAGDAKLDLAPSTYAGQPASGRVQVAGNRQRIARADVDVTLGEAHVTAQGSFGRPEDAMDVAFRAPNLSILAKPFGLALAGRAEGTARLTGTFASPAGNVAVTGTNLVLPSNVAVRELQLRGQAGVEGESPIDAALTARGVAVGTANPPTSVADTLSATLRGTRRQHRFEADVQMDRTTSVNAVLAGGVDPSAKSLAWNGRIETLAMRGQGAFSLASPAPLFISAARIELGDAQLKGDWGEAHLVATRWTPRTLDFKGTTPGLRVQGVARAFRLARLPPSDLVVAADWDLHASESFNGTLDVRRASGDLRVGEPALPLGLRDVALHIDANGGHARARLALTSDRVGRIEGQGTGLITRGPGGWEFSQSAPLDARIVADIPDLAPLQPWLGPESRLGGKLAANVTITGSGRQPRVAGEVRAMQVALREPQTGFEVEQGDIALRMDGRSLVVDRFTAKTPWHPSDRAKDRMRDVAIPPGGGSIGAEGSIDLVAREGTLRFKADHAPLTQLPSRFLAVSGEASLEATRNGLMARGNLKADAGWVGALETPLPSVSEDVVVIRASAPPPAEDTRAREPMRVDAQLSLDNHVWFQGRGLDARLDGSLHVEGEIGTPLRARGTIRTVGGKYKGYGQDLTVERGVLTFDGPLDNPRLNVLALRKGLPVEAGVEVLGTTTHPRVRLVSTPDVPEPEKLAWLVLGRGASDASVGDTGVMMAAARALLGNNNPGSDLTKKFGIDEVKIGRSDTNSVLGVLPQSTVAGRTGTPSASEVVSVGKNINRNLQLTFEQGLADAEGALKVTYRISRQFQLLVRAGYLPGLDAVYRWTFK